MVASGEGRFNEGQGNNYWHPDLRLRFLPLSDEGVKSADRVVPTSRRAMGTFGSF